MTPHASNEVKEEEEEEEVSFAGRLKGSTMSNSDFECQPQETAATKDDVMVLFLSF